MPFGCSNPALKDHPQLGYYSGMLGLRRHMVSVVDYCPEWQELFHVEYESLFRAISNPAVKIEHVGSTAIPDLPAKPILDIAVGVRAISDIPSIVKSITPHGYLDRGIDIKSGDHLCVKESSHEVRTVHLHILEISETRWNDYIKFRDILRRNIVIREKYATLKLALAKQFPNSRDSYTAGKNEFIANVLKHT